MKRTLLLTLLPLAVAAAARADVSATAPRTQSRDALVGGFFYITGIAADADESSPVKAATTVWDRSGEKNATVGLKNYQGSITVVRSALSYGLLRGAGLDVTPSQTPESAFRLASVLMAPDDANRARINQAFKELTGLPLVKKELKQGDRVLVQYDAAGLQAAFDKLYVPPSGTFGGVSARVVYDTLFREFVRNQADAAAALLAHKGFFSAEGKRFIAHSLDAKQQATDDQWTLAGKLGGPLASQPRLVGTLLRRHADGTLPTVIKILRAVLRDYDPETFRRLDAQLKPPTA